MNQLEILKRIALNGQVQLLVGEGNGWPSINKRHNLNRHKERLSEL